MILWAFANLGSQIIDLVKEEHEDKILVILKQIGIRPGVKVCESAIMYFGSLTIFLIPLLVYFQKAWFVDTSFMLLLIEVLLICIQMLFIEIILEYTAKGKTRSMLKAIYYLPQMILGIIATF